MILTASRGSTAHQLVLQLLFNRYLIGMLKNHTSIRGSFRGRLSIAVSFRDRFSIGDRCRGSCTARACW
jgi:hypothetical protein